MHVFGTLNGKTEFVTRIFLTLFLMLDFFIIATYFLAAPLGLSLLFGTSEGMAYAEQNSMFYVLILMMPFRIPAELNLGGLFAVMMVVYTVCLVASWCLSPSLQQTIRDMVEISPLRIFRNWILSMPLISSMLLISIILLQSFQEAQGVSTGSITFASNFEALAELAYSPLLEEIGFRITPIGVFLALESVFIWRMRKRAGSPISLPKLMTLSFLTPERSRKFAGLKTIEENGLLRGIGLPGWIVLLATSLAFGAAHFLSGSGWEIGKISSAFVAGFALSLVYWRYGAHSAVLLHWFFNYYSYVYQLASETYANIFSKILYVMEDVTFWFGIFGWMAILMLFVFRMYGGTREKA